MHHASVVTSLSKPHDSLERMSCILELSSPPAHSLESACLPCRLRTAPATMLPTARRTAPTAPPRRRSMRHPSTLRSQRLLLLLWSPVMTLQVCTVHLSCSCLSDMMQSGCDSLLIACAGRGPGVGGAHRRSLLISTATRSRARALAKRAHRAAPVLALARCSPRRPMRDPGSEPNATDVCAIVSRALRSCLAACAARGVVVLDR